MKRNLFGKADVKVVIDNPQTKGAWIPPIEMQQVLNTVSDHAYVLYSFYRTFPFTESNQIEDDAVAKTLNWQKQKVQRNRLTLEKENLFRTIRYGTKMDGITKVFVGMDVIALFDAGMPCEILEPKAYNKLKKEFSVKSPKDVVTHANAMVSHYEQEPEKYL